MPRNSLIVLLIIACGWFLFDSSLSGMADDAKRKPGASLTERHARERRSQIAGTVSYDMNIEMEKSAEQFGGTVKIEAKLLHKDSDLTLDFTGGEVRSLSINGKEVKKAELEKFYNGFFIRLPSKYLTVGDNKYNVGFTHSYSKTGNGLHRMSDPEDGKVYTYSNFEPYFANYLFPCFDQPDIKARFKLNVSAPQTWQVVSALREDSISAPEKGRRQWSFPATKAISTYIFPLHAGEYHVWEDQDDGVKLRLFARQSLKTYVDHLEWFKITKQGFAFFNTFFGYPYPFEKYDQLIVPDFNWGAMENVGAVTFTEHYAPRSKPAREQRMSRADTILHEMAHMWFGNLVTMKWWNDLWLNESFATYMANLALAEATEFKEAWDVFFKSTKQWAYWEDSLVTRHAITTDVPNTEQAFANFDGITYGKGASSLKQLAFFIGPEKFRSGVQAYFRKYAFSNTTLTDFISALSEAAKVDLSLFTEEWLQTPGTNRIQPVFECNLGKIKSFAIEQTAPSDAPKLRTHKTLIALYQLKGSQATIKKTATVTYAGASTNVAELVNADCPDFINLNYDDHDFVKLVLDGTSLKTAESSLSRMPRKLDRMMIWATLWDMVEETAIDLYKFEQLARNHIDVEQDDQIVSQILSRIAGREGVLNYLPQATKAAEERYKSAVSFWEAKALERMQKAPTDSDSRKIWLENYIKIAASDAAQSRMIEWLSSKKTKLDQDHRWSVLIRLSQLGNKEAPRLIAQETQSDKSSMGETNSLTANAIKPDINIKKKFFARVVAKKSTDRLSAQRAIMRGLFPPDQEGLHRKFADQYFNLLPGLAKRSDAHFTEEFIEAITPSFCSQSSNESLRKFVSYNSALPASALKTLKVKLQMDERCYKIREYTLTSIK